MPNTSAQANPEQLALLEAVTKVLSPLAQLCMGSGLTIQTVQEGLRRAYVQAALKAHTASSEKVSAKPSTDRLTSRISASTGLTRREVDRLLSQHLETPTHKPSAASEVFTRWVSDPLLKDSKGQAKALPKQSEDFSFEKLAQSVTTDVHPRAILEELIRLKLATVDPQTQLIALRQQSFVPLGDRVHMAQYFGDNLSDHLQAACDNLLLDGRQHLEQAVFADELSEHSIQRAHELLSDIWKELLSRLSQEFTQLIEDDQKHQRIQDQRMRVGLYTFNEAMPIPADPS